MLTSLAAHAACCAGRLSKPPKKGQAAKDYNESRELTKAINAENEERTAGVAASSGGQLNVVRVWCVLNTALLPVRQHCSTSHGLPGPQAGAGCRVGPSLPT